MALTLTIDLNELTLEKAEVIAGLILAYAKGYDSGFIEPASPEVQAAAREVMQDPAAAFGSAIPTGVISPAGPSLVLPAETVPTNPTPSPTAPLSGGVTVDKDGLPWDVRIHASSKGLNNDGTWRLKRGVDKTAVEKVTSELRQLMAIPSPGPQLVAPPPPSTTATVAPPPPAVNEVELRQQYIDLFGRVSVAMTGGKLSEAQLSKCLQSIGIPSLPLLGSRPDLVPTACKLIDGVIAGVNA